MLKITMLRNPGIEMDGVKLAFPYNRVDALLYYMMVRGSATRQELIALLWESCDEAVGLKNLRNTLYILKKELGGDFLLSPQKSVITVNPEWMIDCDYQRFLQGETEAYQGSFLDGFAVKRAFAFDEWLCRTRDKLRLEYLNRLGRRAAEAREAGNYSAAVRCAEAYLQEDAFDEGMICLMMECLCSEKKYARAAAVYQQLKERLNAELGAEPQEETTLLYYRIMNSWNSGMQNPDSLPADPPVGRESVYETLSAAIHAFAAGASRGYAQLLIGEAGSGKSELIDRFAGSGTDGALRVVRLICRQSEKDVSMMFWHRLICRLPEETDIEADLPEAVRSRLKRSQAEGIRFDAMLENDSLLIFRMAAQRRRLLLIVEDLQWADSKSVEMLDAVMRRLPAGSLMALISCRENLSEGLQSMLRRMEADSMLRRHWLRPLSREDTERLLTGQLNADVAARLSERFYRATGGNLRLLNMLVRSYRADSGIAATLQTIDEVLLQRVDALSGSARALAQCVSVFSNGADFDLLAEMSDESTAADALKELIDQGIVEETPSSAGAVYCFMVQRIRELMHDSMPPNRRSALHAKAGDLLSARKKPENSAECRDIAGHYCYAGKRQAALEYRIMAVEFDSALLCEPYSGITDQLPGMEQLEAEIEGCMRELAETEDAVRDSRHMQRLERMLILPRARIALYRGDFDGGSDLLGALSGMAGERDLRLQVQACALLSTAALYMQKTDIAERYTTTGIRLLQHIDDPMLQARFDRLRGGCCCLRGDYDVANYYLQESVDTLGKLPGGLNVRLQLAAAYSDIARNYRYVNDYTKASRHFKKAMELMQDGMCTGSVWNYVHYGRMAYALEDHLRARELFARACETARKTGEMWGRAAADAYCAIYAAEDGDTTKAAEMIADAQACAEQMNSALENGILCFAEVQLLRRIVGEKLDAPELLALIGEDAESYARRGIRILENIPDVYEAQALTKMLRSGIMDRQSYRALELYSKKRHFMSE